MAGRRRRATSTSTVATVDQVAVRHYKEASVLKPVSANTHTDDWPCFLLSDAAVYRRDGTLVNQLHVDLEGPFVIRGRLEIEKDNERYRAPLPRTHPTCSLQLFALTDLS
jgi:hypothetical protein